MKLRQKPGTEVEHAIAAVSHRVLREAKHPEALLRHTAVSAARALMAGAFDHVDKPETFAVLVTADRSIASLDGGPHEEFRFHLTHVEADDDDAPALLDALEAIYSTDTPTEIDWGHLRNLLRKHGRL